MEFIAKTQPITQDCIRQFLSAEQTKLLVSYINKEAKWNEDNGIKTQTFSKNRRFGSGKPQEFPLWANMVAKKLYYEKAVDFFPDEVTVIEQRGNSRQEVLDVINSICDNAKRAVAVVLETFSDTKNSIIQPGSVVTSSSYRQVKGFSGKRGKLMFVLFNKS